MRKLFSLFMALLATTSLWAEDFSVGGIYYNYLDGNNVEVTYRGSKYDSYSNEYSGSVEIPAIVNVYGTTYNVTSIGKDAFRGCSTLTSINIPNSVTSIESHSFFGCSEVKAIIIPENITTMGYGVFLQTSLTSVVWNAKNCMITDYIGNGYERETLFYDYYASLDGMHAAISSCPISSFTFGNEVESIPAYLCYGLDKLASITIPNSVTSIGDNVFSGCSSLTSITIPNSVTSIGNGAFSDCSSLTSITIPNSVTSIGNGAFSDCSSLTSITIPNSVTSIGYDAFSGCSSLTSVTIPNSVTSIGDRAFDGCSSLTSMVVETGNTTYDSRDNCNAIIETATNTLVIGCQNTIIPNSVTSIGNSAFSGCSSIRSITIPESVTTIEYYAFGGCTSLTSITLPNSVTSIGNSAFSGCSSIRSITIPESVTTIESSAFYNCTSLQSITCKSETPPTIYNGTFENVSTSIPLYVPCGTVDTYNASTWNYFSNIQESLSEYAIVVSSIDNKQGSAKLDKNSACGSIISATANTGYHFTQWSDGNLDNPRTFIPTQDTTFIAEFAPDRHTISAYTSDSERGTVSGGSTADYGSYVTITATANYGYHFTCWDDGNTDNPRRIQVTKDISFTAYFDKNTYYITKRYNSEHGYIEAPDSAQYLDRLILTATPKHGYSFSHWGDGQKNNPRALLLTQDTTLSAEFIILTSGQCGDDLYWSYDETTKTISITGSGEMYDYTIENQPWALFREDITEVYIDNTVSSIGTSAFNKCKNLGKLSIGGAMNKIAENAFANCSRLYEIECYAVMPPVSDISSFINYNAFVTVLCDSKRLYEADMVWGNFRNIECMEAELEEILADTVVVNSGSTDVTIIWPTEEGADTYTIMIEQDGEVVCTLTFNSEGQLLNIAFAPGRDGNHPVQYAEAVANGKGFRFTVTGLEEGTDYTYDIVVKNEANQVIETHSGKFTTESMSGVENIGTSNSAVQKLFRNGRLIIVRDGVEYNAMGQEL